VAEEQARRVQDDSREVALARMLNLSESDRRIGADARDKTGNPYELKTTTTGSLGTGRDIGYTYLAHMRTRYWIAAKGKQTRYGFSFEEIYFLHPDDLEEWINGIESRLKADDVLIEAAADALVQAGRPAADVARLRYLGSRGATLNNPKIPWAYVTKRGRLLGQHPELDLAELVKARPLAVRQDALAALNPTLGLPLDAETPQEGG